MSAATPDPTATPQEAAGTSSRALLTISEAAAASGKDRRTIRRHLDAGRFPGAQRTDSTSGPVWRIPVDELLAAGLTLHAPDQPAPAPPAPDLYTLAQLRAEVAEWRRRAEVAEARAEMAERIAAERGEHLVDLRRLVAPLEPAPADRTPEARARWWRRGGR